MYEYEKKILFSDVDVHSQMSISAMMNAMFDIISINSESIGRGIDYMLSKRRTWFAIGWNIVIKRYPALLEEITVKTWPYDFGTGLAHRNVVITDKSGEDIAYADSIWTLMDMDIGHPTRITEEDARGYELYDRYPMEKMKRKLDCVSNMAVIDEYVVRRSDIDYNGHMSNGVYIRLAADCTEDKSMIRQIKVEYKKQSRLGERLVIRCGRQDNILQYAISGKEDGDIKAIIHFME